MTANDPVVPVAPVPDPAPVAPVVEKKRDIKKLGKKILSRVLVPVAIGATAAAVVSRSRSNDTDNETVDEFDVTTE